MRFRGSGNNRRNRDLLLPHGTREDSVQLQQSQSSSLKSRETGIPWRITHIGGRSTFSPVDTVSLKLVSGRQKLTSRCSKNAVILQRVELSRHLDYSYMEEVLKISSYTPRWGKSNVMRFPQTWRSGIRRAEALQLRGRF